MILTGKTEDGLIVAFQVEHTAVHDQSRHVRRCSGSNDGDRVVDTAREVEHALIHIPNTRTGVLSQLRFEQIQRSRTVLDDLIVGQNVGVEIQRSCRVELLEDHLVAYTRVEAAVDAGGAVAEGEEPAKGVRERHRVGDSRQGAATVNRQAVRRGGSENLGGVDSQVHAGGQHPVEAGRQFGSRERPHAGVGQPRGKARARASGGGVGDDVGPHEHGRRTGSGLRRGLEVRSDGGEVGDAGSWGCAQIGPAHQKPVGTPKVRDGADIKAERLAGVWHQGERAHPVEAVEGTAGGDVGGEEAFHRGRGGIPDDLEFAALQREIAVGAAQAVIEVGRCVVEEEQTTRRDDVGAEGRAACGSTEREGTLRNRQCPQIVAAGARGGIDRHDARPDLVDIERGSELCAAGEASGEGEVGVVKADAGHGGRSAVGEEAGSCHRAQHCGCGVEVERAVCTEGDLREARGPIGRADRQNPAAHRSDAGVRVRGVTQRQNPIASLCKRVSTGKR